MSKVYSHTCKKPCDMIAKIKCEKPCQINIESDAIINIEDILEEEATRELLKRQEATKARQNQIRKEENAKRQEIARKQEEQRMLEIARKQEEQRMLEIARKQEEQKMLEMARKQEEQRKLEMARKQEEQRMLEIATKQEQKRQQAQELAKRPLASSIKSKNSCMTISGYNNRANSCYLDSALFALFAFETLFINSEILQIEDDTLYDRIFSSRLFKNEEDVNKVFEYVKKIRALLNEVFLRIKPSAGISKEKSCVNLRNELLKNPSEILKAKPNKFWASGEQQDSSEFLICIMNTFFITNIVAKTNSVKINNILGYKEVSSTSSIIVSPVIQINVSQINSIDEYFLLSESNTLEPLEELISEDDLNKPDIIRYRKIKLMYRIFNLLVGFCKIKDKYELEVQKLSSKNVIYKNILNKLQITAQKFNEVDDLDFDDINRLYNEIIANIKVAKGYTAALISTLNKINTDPTKGHFKTHLEMLEKVKYFNEIQKMTEYSFVKDTEPYLVLSLSRFGDDGRKNRKPIDFNEVIEIDENQLKLNAIIIHSGTTIRGGHYICAFRCNDNWYLYNDIPSSTITKIGTFRNLYNYKYGGSTSCLEDANILIYSLSEPTI